MYPSRYDRSSGIGRLLWWAFWVLLIVYVFSRPSEAAAHSRDLLAGIENAGEAIVTFIQQARGGR